MTAHAPVNFLLVDDLEENLLALEGLLRRNELNLLLARSGPEALELLLKHEVALALIDVQMPGMDGFELAELMRGTERTRRVPIIFLTAGTADRQRRFRGYEAGAVDFLQKPIEPDILRSKAEVFFELFRQCQEVSLQRDELKLATIENARLLEESRRQAAALREADQRKDEFLAMLAHELRNPLAPVRSAVEILRLSGLQDPHLDSAREIISRQVSHMVRLIDDLLDVARIVRGKVQLRRETCDLAEIVRQTAEDYRPTLVESGLSLDLNIVETPVQVHGDPIRLAQIVGNLLHNAGKFTPAGGSVRVQVETNAERGTAIVSVRDTGIGLDVSAIARMFEPFSQADQTLDRTKGGLGLGLALAKGLIELHEGTVTAESDGPGRGATFTLTLPLSNRAAVQDATPAANGEAAAKGCRILIVEDHADAANTLRRLLELLGHEVESASDGESALTALVRFQPNIVISDLGLPGKIDGYEIARTIRRDPALDAVALIALSGYGMEADRRRAEEAGFDRSLVKPVSLAVLQEVLAEAGSHASCGPA